MLRQSRATAGRQPKQTSEAALRRRAVAQEALKYLAAKDADRSRLEPGAVHGVLLEIRAVVDGHPHWERHAGSLSIGHDQQYAASSGADPAHLVGYLVSLLSRARRRQVLEDLPAIYRESGLPPIGEEQREAAERLLKQLRDTETRTRRGSVRFERDEIKIESDG